MYGKSISPIQVLNFEAFMLDPSVMISDSDIVDQYHCDYHPPWIKSRSGLGTI